jgi:hypothetical protein
LETSQGERMHAGFRVRSSIALELVIKLAIGHILFAI